MMNQIKRFKLPTHSFEFYFYFLLIQTEKVALSK